MVHPDDRASLVETSREAVRAGKPYDIPFRAVLRDGSIKHLHSVGNPAFQDSGEVSEYIGVTMDVTERTHTEAALQEAQSNLARAARLTTMGELAASIAHEINQPLSAVITNGNASLRWLDREPPDLEKTKAALIRVIKAGHGASEVISRIRALLKNEKPNYVEVDINDVIREVLTLTNGTLRNRNVVVRTRLLNARSLILGDRIQLQQVITNLIINGADAMNAITDRPRSLRIESQIEGSGKLLVSIEDAGTGLDPSVAERIFDPLFTTKPNGMGMGLSICRSIVEAHGGRLGASAAVPHGAVFQFTLPICDSADQGPSRKTAEAIRTSCPTD
jgi:C4-dicarboxylate-specific signal transduction histidine kinase